MTVQPCTTHARRRSRCRKKSSFNSQHWSIMIHQQDTRNPVSSIKNKNAGARKPNHEPQQQPWCYRKTAEPFCVQYHVQIKITTSDSGVASKTVTSMPPSTVFTHQTQTGGNGAEKDKGTRAFVLRINNHVLHSPLSSLHPVEYRRQSNKTPTYHQQRPKSMSDQILNTTV